MHHQNTADQTPNLLFDSTNSSILQIKQKNNNNHNFNKANRKQQIVIVNIRFRVLECRCFAQLVMPFAKWSLEPVCLGRGSTPWSQSSHNHHSHGQSAAINRSENSSSAGDETTATSTDSTSVTLTPYRIYLEPIVNNDSTGENDSEYSAGECDTLLANIQTRVLIGAIRQLGALAVAADQLFSELTEECQRLCERTVSLRTRTDRLSANIDRANLTMKRTAPQVGNLIAEYARLSTAERWQSRPYAQYNLFTPDTRPWSIQDVYSRAHAPGDVRLSRGVAANGVARANGAAGHTLGYPSPFVTIMRNSRRRDRATTASRTCVRASHPPDCRCSCHSASSSSPPKSGHNPHPHHAHYQLQPQHHTSNHINRKRNSSSPSSVVTWSSLASSSVFAPSELYPKAASTAIRQQGPRRSQTIDDFFREHNVHHNANDDEHLSGHSPGTESRYENGDCDQCDCQDEAASGMLSRQESVSTQRSINDSTQQHWGWMMSDDEHRRWSSALAAPLKPANLDELSIWMRENIETRKPENIVFKSVSDLGDAELEQKLRPIHTLSLRSPPETEMETESESEESRRTSKLKRRWSLLIPKLRRRAPTNDRDGQATGRNEPFFSRLTRNRQSLPPGSRIARSDGASTSQQQQQQQQAQASPSDVGPNQTDDSTTVREVYLITPSERAAILANLYAVPHEVDINVTGRNFDRLSSTRRSLIHSDFHVPRHRIAGLSRSRSPHKSVRTLNRPKDKSPKTPVAERACQTDDLGGRQNYPNRTQVAVEVHQNPGTSDSLRHLSSSSSTLDRAHSLPRSAITRSAIIQAAQNKQKVLQKKKSNNYRSSSGNWSAATSDFLGSSASSSPLHVPSRGRVRRQNSNETTATQNGQQPPGTEEVESVYSCDNDGYYTSMHTDSLLFGYSGNTAPAKSRSHGLAQQFRRAFEEIKEESSNAGSKSNLLGSKDGFYGSNVSINSILSQSTDAQAGAESAVIEFDCSVSHCSHQFEHSERQMMIYAKPTIDTLPEEDSDATLRSGSSASYRKTVKKSVSLRNSNNENARKRQTMSALTRSVTSVEQKSKCQASSSLKNSATSSSSRTLLGRHSSLTESSSTSSLCRRMPPPPPPPRVSSMLSTLKQFQDDNKQNSEQQQQQRESPTDDDLDTASMSLVSDSRQDNRCDSVASSLVESASHYSYSGRPANDHNDGTTNNSHQNQQSVAESETNSEYLLNANERRQRLFMNVDSARSYPPLSYIASYDHAEPDPETATTLSVSSSVCFEDDDGDDGRPATNCSTVSSSNTITPETRLDDEQSMKSYNNEEQDVETASVATLERRHLSSPTPAPKLDSVVNMRPKPEGSKTPPTPAPRNSLHISVDEEDENGGPLGSFSTMTTPTQKLTSPMASKIQSISADNSPALSNRRQFTAQDLYTIVHNQKRKHNIKTSPTIYTTASQIRSKTDDDANPTMHSTTLPRVQGPKRHSLAEPPQSPSKKEHCSISGRLGPLRPTTLHDFKKLLSQVRPSGTVSGTSGPKVSPNSSTYSSLQQVLKSVAGGLDGSQDQETPSSEMMASVASTCSTESGVYSMLSPCSEDSVSPLKTSPEHRPVNNSNTVTSPVRKRAFAAGLASNKTTENMIANANSMNDFIRKFAKQKLTAVNGGVGSGPGLSATARLEAANKSPCPPIPEDEQEPTVLEEDGPPVDPSSTWV